MASLKQKIARILYPLILRLGKKGRNGTVLDNTRQAQAKVSLYEQHILLNNGSKLDLETLSGRKILLVNTASECGYTGQFAELQTLHEKYGEKLAIIGFPSNDFRQQEKGSNEDIARFCQVNYGVTFPIAQKAVVVKNVVQHPVFKWLTQSSANGWNDHAPDWNFGKYLVDETGNLINYFGPSISPLDDVVLKAIGSYELILKNGKH
jgi:glutathione peroxidase